MAALIESVEPLRCQLIVLFLSLLWQYSYGYRVSAVHSSIESFEAEHIGARAGELRRGVRGPFALEQHNTRTLKFGPLGFQFSLRDGLPVVADASFKNRGFPQGDLLINPGDDNRKRPRERLRLHIGMNVAR